MPFGDGRGPLWANSNYGGRGYGRGLGRGLGLGYGRGLGYHGDYLRETSNKELLEEERRSLQERLKEIESLLNR